MQRLTSHLTATIPAGGWLQRVWSELAARWRSPLFRKYAGLLFTMLAGLLIANAAIQMYYAWRESRAAISSVQREKAQGAAAVIEQFLKEIEGQVGWTTHANVLSGATGIDQRRFDFLRLLRQAPAVTELTHIDAEGREQLKVSRLAMDVTGSGADYTNDPRFVAAKAQRRHVSTVYFRKESEPYLTLSIAGQGRNAGVTIAEVNLKFIWDVISRIEVGKAGVAYVVDQGGLLIAHPDIGLVLRKTDMSGLGHVAAARVRLKNPRAPLPETGRDRHGQDVLTASAPIPSLGWLVMVDQPLAEALTPVRGTLNRSLLVLFGGLTLAVLGGLWLARRMAVPINALAEGAERMGAGDLDHRIDLKTGDEIERLGQAFNDMGARLKESYAGLEQKVDERTKELAESLEYQTAVSDVLGVIARAPGELQPVLDRILTTAARLCEAEMGLIHVQRGEVVQPEASFGYTPQIVEEYRKLRLTPGQGTVSGRALASGRTAQIEDVLAEPGYELLDVQRIGGHRTTIAVPLKRGAATFGLINLSRRIVRPFTPAQIALVETFADQAVIAIENARLFEAEQTRTKELTESLEYQTAIAEVLGVISRSPTELQPVLDAIATTAHRICEAERGTIWQLDGDRLHVKAHVNLEPDYIAYLSANPIPSGHGSVSGRAIASGKVQHVTDVQADPKLAGMPQLKVGGQRTMLSVPLLRAGQAIGTITMSRREVRPFTPRQIALVETFADQAVIAIENARLFEAEQTRTKEVEAKSAELTESLEYQTAISEVLGVISRSPDQVQPVLDSIAATAKRLCEARSALIWRPAGDVLELTAHTDMSSPERIAYLRSHPIKLDGAMLTSRAFLERRTFHVHDVMAEPELARLETNRTGQQRSVLCVPLLRRGEAVGVIALTRRVVSPFTERQIDLVTTFANQAVIAIENARLFEAEQTRTKELTESLEYQTATSEVLGVISRSPNDLQPVLDAIVETAVRLAHADFAHVLTEHDGKYRLVATNQQDTDMVRHLKAHPVVAEQRGSILARAIRGRVTVHVADTRSDPEAEGGLISFGATRSSLAVPLMRAGHVVGGIVLTRNVQQAYSDREIRLVETFADQAVIAMNNARLFEEVQQRTREVTESLEYQTATSEVLGVISRSPNELQPVLDSIVETAVRLCNADRAYFNVVRDGEIPLVATFGAPDDVVEDVKARQLVPDRGSAAGRALLEKRPIHIPDARFDPEWTLYDATDPRRARSMVSVPLVRGDSVVGVITVVRLQATAFTERQIALLETFADQAVIAINNVGLFEEVQARTKELQESLEFQTATSDVLSVISRSPNELQPILDAIVETAVRLCRATHGHVRLLREDGAYHIAAHQIPDAELLEAMRQNPFRPGVDSISGRAALDGRTVHVPDIAADPLVSGFQRQMADKVASVIAAPLKRNGEVVGLICVFHTRERPLTFTDRQIKLVETFADQAVIAINNVGLFEEVQARTREVTESLEYQTATSDVLGVISRSPNELQPVLDRIARTARGLCHAERAAIRLLDGDQFRLMAVDGSDLSAEFEVVNAKALIAADRGSMTGRVAIEGRAVHCHDIQADPDYTLHRDQGADYRRTMLGVPLLRHGSVVGTIVLSRSTVQPFTDREVDLVTTFADQAVIAINNVRLFEEVQARTQELTESLEYQTAISDVLGVIARSPNELQPVLDAIAEIAERLCAADRAQIFTRVMDRYHLAAHRNTSPEFLAYLAEQPFEPGRGNTTSLAALEARTVHVPDIVVDPDYDRSRTYGSPGGSRLSVPLIHRGAVLGVITMARNEVRPFAQRQIDLVTTFANQAVIAINNVGLFEEVQARTKEVEARSAELQESLEYQTATSDVLGVIARSPGDIQPVFEEILTTASRLCRADSALLFRVEGEHCHTVASNNVKSGLLELLRANPVPVAPESITGRAAHERRTIHVPDELAAPEFASRRKFQQSGGQRTILAVPLIHEGKAIGVITLFRFEVDPFTQRQIDLVTTFANQAVIAINNVDLFEAVQTRTKELARSVEELQSLGAVSRSVSATLDMSQVLETVLENACRMAYAGGGTVYVYDKEAGEFRLEAGHNMSEIHIQRVREQPIRMGDAVVGECGSRREVVQVADLQAPDAPRTSLIEILIRDGVRAILAVPLLHQGEVIGALVIRRTFPGAFSPEIVGLLEAFAAQSATAVNNARLFKDIEEKGRQLELASQHKSQFLANMSHELRTPLNAILGYTELLTDGTYGDLAERPKGVLERIDRNGKHLLGLINDVLDLSKIEAGEMQLSLEDYALGSLVQNTITVTEPLARQKGLELRASIAPNLPLGRGDARRLSQVLLNLVGNAIKFTDTGRIDVTATLDRDQFHIAVTDTGPGIPPAEQTKIFEKFQQVDNTSTRRKGGSGLGLSISKELVEMHGGTIAVSSSVGQGSTFEVRLPRRICPLKEAS